MLVGLGKVFVVMWNLLQWPVVAAVMLIVVGIITCYIPDIHQDWRWVSPGSVFAVAMWLVVSLGFKTYVDHFADYNKVYGSIAGVIVLMLWLYWSGMVLLLGGEINAEIEKAATAQDMSNQEQGESRLDGWPSCYLGDQLGGFVSTLHARVSTRLETVRRGERTGYEQK